MTITDLFDDVEIDDVDDLGVTELEEFEHWLDEVNKYNDLIDFGSFHDTIEECYRG